jgi:hypothetical protein
MRPRGGVFFHQHLPQCRFAAACISLSLSPVALFRVHLSLAFYTRRAAPMRIIVCMCVHRNVRARGKRVYMFYNCALYSGVQQGGHLVRPGARARNRVALSHGASARC